MFDPLHRLHRKPLDLFLFYFAGHGIEVDKKLTLFPRMGSLPSLTPASRLRRC